MAILWQKTVDGTQYEVRQAGNSVRLYTDGVFHSQYNPQHSVTRSVWDLLMLPAFFQEPKNIQRVLVLGVGGGSVIHLLNRYVNPQEIVGVEISSVHLAIAKKYFGVNYKNTRLHRGDAIAWLDNYQGPPFDMIIDDLFGEVDGEGVRAIPLNAKWLTLLRKHTTKNGIIVANMVDRQSLIQSALYSNKSIAKAFKSVFQLSMPQYENLVTAFLKQPSQPATLRKSIKQIKGLNIPSGPDKLSFKIKQIK